MLMNSKTVIKPITADDLQAIVRIQESILRKRVDPAWENLIRNELTKTESVCLAAEQNGEIKGFFVGRIRYGDFGLEKSGWIEMVGVSPGAMGSGVGKALAGAAMDFFVKNNIKNIYTAVQWDSGDMLAYFSSMNFQLSEFITLIAHPE